MAEFSEHKLLSLCKALIEEKINGKTKSQWKQRDLEYISDLIYEKSKVKISSSTLRRLWQDDYKAIPQVSTLNALAIFLDFESWNDFKNKHSNQYITKSKEKKKPIPKLYIRIILALVILILAIIAFLYLTHCETPKKLPINKDKVQFSITKNLDIGVPNTAGFNYDISQIDFDSAFIQQSWDPTRRTQKKKYPA